MIDIHTHPLCVNEGQDFPQVAPLIARAKQHGIQHCVALGDVLAFGRLPTAQQIRKINEDTAKVVHSHPKFFTGFCHLNPTLGERAVWSEVEHGIELGLRGIKLEIANNARDACMKPVMQAAARHDLIVLQHAWSMTKIRQRRYHTDPEDAAWLARKHPGVRMIMAHLTGCGVRGVLAAKHIDNLWVDTSGAAPEAGIVEYAVEHLGDRRILYGSDIPIRDFASALARITGSALSKRSQQRILNDNARELLRLS
ncbi:amidohydrolase [Nibricoccus aquaticus]|uniref:Amidohydrolase n=1 Tax=Nibricoccus aquaticus TaxID=2576891 RepID=A0A290QGX9_9BACT|nr:amidohydrolase family protein [Nibricoccus aquaticus]ATC64598.1 amidohydrolase [Nibricoccus aquaticus]